MNSDPLLRLVEIYLVMCHGKNVQKSKRIVKEVERFIELKNEFGAEVGPSPLVDQAWHAAILNTEEYSNYCTRKFGHMVHHSTSTITDSFAQKNERIKKTMEEYRKKYNLIDVGIWKLYNIEGDNNNNNNNSNNGNGDDDNLFGVNLPSSNPPSFSFGVPSSNPPSFSFGVPSSSNQNNNNNNNNNNRKRKNSEKVSRNVKERRSEEEKNENITIFVLNLDLRAKFPITVSPTTTTLGMLLNQVCSEKNIEPDNQKLDILEEFDLEKKIAECNINDGDQIVMFEERESLYC